MKAAEFIFLIIATVFCLILVNSPNAAAALIAQACLVFCLAVVWWEARG